MKKSLLLLLFAVLLTACGKDDEPAKVADLNVKALTSYIGQSRSYVIEHFKDGTPLSETISLLMYDLNTPKSKFSLTFKTGTDNLIKSIEIYALCDSYASGMETFKYEMDKINSTITHVTYMGRYHSKTDGLIDFSNRSELWDYINEKGVSTSVYETWWIENSTNVKFTVEGQFYRPNNSITIEIKKSVW